MNPKRRWELLLRNDEPAGDLLKRQLLGLAVDVSVELFHALSLLEKGGPTVAKRTEVLDIDYCLYVMSFGTTGISLMLVEDIRSCGIWLIGVERSERAEYSLAREARRFLRLVNPAVER